MQEEERRFNWIYLYLDAIRWSIVNEVSSGDFRQIVTIQDLLNAKNEWWINQLRSDVELQRWLKVKQSHGCSFLPAMRSDLHYIYDLEAELWGANWDKYFDWRTTDHGVYVEPFRMVALFYLIERILKLFLSFLKFYNYQRKDTSHATLRNVTFDSFFGTHKMNRWLPHPFNLTANTSNIKQGDESHQRHKAYSFSGNHYSVIRKTHYADVLHGALKQAAKHERERCTNKKQNRRPKKGSIEGYFFDSFWHYSESYRYRIPLAGSYVRIHPFYWGLNIRWIGSFFVTLCETWMFSLSPAEMEACWSDYKQFPHSAILQDIQQFRWEKIKNSRPQDLF